VIPAGRLPALDKGLPEDRVARSTFFPFAPGFAAIGLHAPERTHQKANKAAHNGGSGGLIWLRLGFRPEADPLQITFGEKDR
jgi:hypothetical protein